MINSNDTDGFLMSELIPSSNSPRILASAAAVIDCVNTVRNIGDGVKTLKLMNTFLEYFQLHFYLLFIPRRVIIKHYCQIFLLPRDDENFSSMGYFHGNFLTFWKSWNPEVDKKCVVRKVQSLILRLKYWECSVGFFVVFDVFLSTYKT